MTALAAKFEAFDSTRLAVLAMLLAVSFALLPSLALPSLTLSGLTLSGNLLLRYP